MLVFSLFWVVWVEDLSTVVLCVVRYLYCVSVSPSSMIALALPKKNSKFPNPQG